MRHPIPNLEHQFLGSDRTAAMATRFMEGEKPDLFGALSERLESMIALQAQAYPLDWSDADKREMAMRHLFGRPATNIFKPLHIARANGAAVDDGGPGKAPPRETGEPR